MKITPNQDRLRLRMLDPRKDKSEGGIHIPIIAQVEPKVFEAKVLEVGPDVKLYKPGNTVLIPARILGDRLTDMTVFVRENEVFALVEDSLIVEVGGVLVPA